MFTTDSFGNIYFPAGLSLASIPATTGTQARVLVPGANGRISSATVAQLITQSGGNLVSSIFGRTGVVVAKEGDYTTDQITEGQAQYFSNSKARKAINLTTFNTSGPATYDSFTGILNIPQYGSGTASPTNFVPLTRTITINGQTADLSVDRIFSVASMVYPSAGIPLSTGTAWETSITNNSANWNTAYGWGNHAGLYSLLNHVHTIANVTGLQTALDGKEPTITAGTTSQYWRGDKTWQTLPTYNLSLYVPYTGATGAVNLGAYAFQAGGIITTGRTTSDIGGSFVMKIGNGTNNVGDANSVTMYAPTASQLMFIYKDALVTKLVSVSPNQPDNSQRYFSWPSVDGQLALVSQLPSLAGYVPYTGATSNVNLGSRNLLLGSGNAGGHIDLVGSTDTAYLNVESAGAQINYNSSRITLTDKQFGGTFTLDLRPSLTTGNAFVQYFQPVTGTIALINDIPSLTGYVTLASSQTISGQKTFSTSPIIDNGTSGIPLRFKQYSNTNFSLAGYTDIIPIGATTLAFSFGQTGVNAKLAYLSAAGLTDNTARIYTLPNVSGTLALTSDIVGYTLPTASTTVLGGVKVDGTTITIASGVISGANTYSLPIASATVLGGIKVGTNLSIDANGVLSSTDTNTTYTLAGLGGLPLAGGIMTGAITLKEGAANGLKFPNDVFGGSGDTAGMRLITRAGESMSLEVYLTNDADDWFNIVVPNTNGAKVNGNTIWHAGNLTNLDQLTNGPGYITSYTDTNTWNANSKDVAGYVAAPGAIANKVWKTDASGNPAWRDDADTDTNTTYTAGAGLTLTGTSFSVTKTITAVETADTIALRNGSGQLVATGFFQASSRTLKTNIAPFTRSALDIIRDVTVVSFNYKKDIINKHIGFIAEDTPEELSTRNKNVMDSNNTIGVLLKAMQELEAKVKELEAKCNEK